ncbi:peptidylprolyl isomerase [Tissierella sp. Yu-01]|uniref:peptidylprolyl isomerase n=1 Tax=Tissierella sp. Yu-01 TaxID=3035694 RepID=UPI00240E20D6|nr:peptidylprolyl isomerase [Tissierella sp. Yu-01]WFA07741.1 peptidylprolyl isomerase [Tissierella sp. Yu-01]
MNNFNRKKLSLILGIMILAFGLFGCTSKNVEGLVAEVNGEGITEEEFNADYKVFRTLYEKQYGADALDHVGTDGKTLDETLKESILEKLIMERLVAKEADEMNVTVTDEDVDALLDQYVIDMGGQEFFDEFLTSSEISEEFFETNMRKELLVEKHKEEFLKGINITEEEAKEFFEENEDALIVLNASHILVATEEEGKAILDRLEKGEDFAALATLESIDSVSAAKGGDLGYFTKGEMISEFEDAAFALEEGEISGLVKTEVGYHIIQLNERKDTYEDLESEIITILKDEQYINKVQELRNDAKVEKYLDTSK